MNRSASAARGQHQTHHRGAARHSPLVSYLAVGYTLLVAYASLYPFRTWRSPTDGALSFLLAPWPRYYTFFDLLVNVVAYVPLGFLFALAAMSRLAPRWAALAAMLAGTALSLAVEVVQGFILERVSSNLDLLSNGLGAMLGALLALATGRRWVLSGNLYRLRQHLFLPGAAVDLGFIVLLLWLFTQLNPAVWLFGNGDLRDLVQPAANLDFSPATYRWIETGVTSFNLAGICLLTLALARPGHTLAGPLLVLVGAALALKSVAALTLFNPGDAALWLTPGSMLGIPAGLLVYLALSKLPRWGVSVCAAALILAGATLLNAAPENPYIQASIQIWRYGHFLSFNGVTQFVSRIWPLVAFAYLVWLMRVGLHPD